MILALNIKYIHNVSRRSMKPQLWCYFPFQQLLIISYIDLSRITRPMRQKTSFFDILIFSSARFNMLVRLTYCFVFNFLLPKQYLRIIGCICTCYCRAELGRKMKLKWWKMAVFEKDSNFHFWNIGQFQVPIRPKEYYRKRCTRWFSEPLRPTCWLWSNISQYQPGPHWNGA